MPVPATIADLTTSEATNYPADSDSVTPTTRPSDYIRAHAAIIKTLGNTVDALDAATQPLDSTLTAISGDTLLPTIADGTLGAFSHRNKIINGAMLVAQEGTSFSGVGPTVVKYPVDQFYYYEESGGTGVVTVSQSTSAPNTNFNASAMVTVTTADASMAAGDAYLLRQTIEGYNVRDLIGNPFTLSFWVRSSVTGIHSISLSNGNNDRSYLAEYTINAANTWEFKTITVAGGLITAGTWDWINGSGLRVTWSLGCGSTYSSATLGSWLTGAYFTSSNQVNCLGTVGNVFALTGVQLERGSVATPFEHRSHGTELALCQRYYLNINLGGRYSSETINGSLVYRGYEAFPVTMRSTPTVTTIGYAGGGSYVLEYQTVNGFSWGSNSPTGDPFITGYVATSRLV